MMVRSDRTQQYSHADSHSHNPQLYVYLYTATLWLVSPILKMIFKSLVGAFAAINVLSTVAAHNIQLRAHSRECFHEELHKDDKMTVTFQVGDREFGGSGNLDIDFYVWPSSRILPVFSMRFLTTIDSFDQNFVYRDTMVLLRKQSIHVDIIKT